MAEMSEIYTIREAPEHFFSEHPDLVCFETIVLLTQTLKDFDQQPADDLRLHDFNALQLLAARLEVPNWRITFSRPKPDAQTRTRFRYLRRDDLTLLLFFRLALQKLSLLLASPAP